MKKLFDKRKKELTTITFSILSFILLILPSISHSQQMESGSGIQNPLKGITSITGFVSVLLGYVVRIGAVVAVFAFIYSGYLFVKARGNPKELETAKTVFINTVIGVAVLLGAQLIATIIVGTINNIKG